MAYTQILCEIQDLAPTPDELFEAAIVAKEHIRAIRFRKTARYIVASALEREGADLHKLRREVRAIFEHTKPHDCDGSKVPLHFDDAADIAIAFVASGLPLNKAEQIVESVISRFAIADFLEGASPEVVAEEMRCTLGNCIDE